MNKREARLMAQAGVDRAKLAEMMARVDPDQLAGQSVVNPGFTKRAIYDMFAHVFEGEPAHNGWRRKPGDVMAAQNALREFGEFWQE